ncbi:MAG TPA: hypothetical protein IGS53_20340 [Leptolyngbyaceae cyanobacterium M33_DOE_097]|uniref:Uncharacterized protein n=1 Tax=Oscillatoriales cyanobacterium SpSt-418 TaxID=2282169 RepID=A0A7C3PCE6_9CYAN|nr:hypothetical protein [Leptolyngbyaceae cyanobacterium M33_DOE_097]
MVDAHKSVRKTAQSLQQTCTKQFPLVIASIGILSLGLLSSRAIAAPRQYVSTVNVSSSQQPYDALVRQAEAQAQQIIRSAFAQNPGLTEASVTVLGRRNYQEIPLLVVTVSRADWQRSPNIRTWANYAGYSAKVLLGYVEPTQPTNPAASAPVSGTPNNATQPDAVFVSPAPSSGQTSGTTGTSGTGQTAPAGGNAQSTPSNPSSGGGFGQPVGSPQTTPNGGNAQSVPASPSAGSSVGQPVTSPQSAPNGGNAQSVPSNPSSGGNVGQPVSAPQVAPNGGNAQPIPASPSAGSGVGNTNTPQSIQDDPGFRDD